MDNNIFERLKAIAIVKDLKLDSFDIVDLLMSVEEEFGVVIDEGSVADIKTVADVVAFIENAK